MHAERMRDVEITGGGTWRCDDTYGLLADHKDDVYAAQPIAPASKGAMAVTTTSPAAGLVAGDYLLIYTGTAVAGSFPPAFPIGTPDAELNQVASVSGSTVNLAWPLAKNYAQEYYQPGQGIGTDTSPSFTGPAAPLALRKIDPAVNITIDGITVDHRGSGAFIAGHQIINLQMSNITGETAGHFHSISAWTGKMQFCTVHTSKADLGQWFSVAYGARDATCQNCTFTATFCGYIHLHEGASNILVKDTTCTSAAGVNGPIDESVIGCRGRGYDLHLDNVTVTNAPESSGGSCLRVDANVSGTAVGCHFSGGTTPIVNGSSTFTVAP
jgi:hypothetical protein